MNEQLKKRLDHAERRMHDEVKSRFAWLRQEVNALEALEYMKNNLGGMYLQPTFRVATLGTFYIEVEVKLYKHLGPFIRKFRQMGWKRRYAHTEATNTPYWEFTHEKYEGVTLTFRANFPTDGNGDACHLEEVGRETREVPIMKLVCPDGQADFSELN